MNFTIMRNKIFIMESIIILSLMEWSRQKLKYQINVEGKVQTSVHIDKYCTFNIWRIYV